MPAFKLLPACKDYIWGGQRLKTDFGVHSELDPLAEAWVLSCHPDGPSVLADGPFAGKTLPEYLAEAGPGALGTRCTKFENFPMLIKLIDAKKDLSYRSTPPTHMHWPMRGSMVRPRCGLSLTPRPARDYTMVLNGRSAGRSLPAGSRTGRWRRFCTVWP